MKKLSIIALALAASLMLSACNGGTYERDDDDDDDRGGTHENVDKSDKDEVPDIEPISPSQLQYCDVDKETSIYWGSGIKIQEAFTNETEIRFPDAIDGKVVLVISEYLDYPEDIKTLIFPEEAVSLGTIPSSVEVLGLGKYIDPAKVKTENCENIKVLIISDRAKDFSSRHFEKYSDNVKIYYKGKKYTKDNFPYTE